MEFLSIGSHDFNPAASGLIPRSWNCLHTAIYSSNVVGSAILLSANNCLLCSEAEPEKTDDGKAKIRMTYWNSEDTVKTLLEYLKEKVPDVEIEFQFIDNSNYDTVVVVGSAILLSANNCLL